MKKVKEIKYVAYYRIMPEEIEAYIQIGEKSLVKDGSKKIGDTSAPRMTIIVFSDENNAKKDRKELEALLIRLKGKNSIIDFARVL